MRTVKASLLVLFGLLLPVQVPASDPAIPTRLCSEETFNYRAKFEQLLHAAFEQDFHAFRTVNGSNKYGFAPEIISSWKGELKTSEGFAEFSGIEAKDKKMPVIDKWVLLHKSQPNPLHGYRLFYTSITRWVWNDYANEFQVRKSHWLAHYYDGCTLKLLQETDVPYWLGDEKEETQ